MSQPPPEPTDSQSPPPGYGPPAYTPGYPPQYATPGYTPQYGFMPYYLTPPEALLGPAKRASIMLFILGALFLLGGTCIGTLVSLVDQETMAKLVDDLRRMNPQQSSLITPTFVRTVYGVFAAVIGLIGIVAIILGVVTRSGRMAAAIVSLVLVVLPGLVLGLMLLFSVIAGAANPEALLGSLFLLVPLALIALTIIFLIGAIRAAPQIELARRQMQAMHQHQQMQYQAYVQQQQPPID